MHHKILIDHPIYVRSGNFWLLKVTVKIYIGVCEINAYVHIVTYMYLKYYYNYITHCNDVPNVS